MFEMSLATANRKQVWKWRIGSGCVVGASGAMSLDTVVDRLRHILPAGQINEQFIAMALIIAFVTGLPLFAFPRVVTVSLAQLGFATGLVYIGYSVLEVFRPQYDVVLIAVVLIVALVLLIVFSSGILYYHREKSRSDECLAVVSLLLFVTLWTYPSFHMIGGLQ